MRYDLSRGLAAKTVTEGVRMSSSQGLVQSMLEVGSSHQSLTDRVLDVLREMIIAGDLPPGERLHERNLSAKLEVSRVPLRESVIRLAQEGFVEVIPRRGAFVAGVTETSVGELFDVRETLEGLAASFAAQRRTDTDIETMNQFIAREDAPAGPEAVAADAGFHQALVVAAHHEMLASLMKPIQGHVRRLFHITSGQLHISMAHEHRRIVDAISTSDHRLARRLAEQHARDVRRATAEFLGFGLSVAELHPPDKEGTF